MSTAINITVDDGGLSARNRQQVAANRQALVQKIAREQSTALGVDKRSQERIAQGRDPATGALLIPPASTGSLGASGGGIPRLNQQPAANRTQRIEEYRWLLDFRQVEVNSASGTDWSATGPFQERNNTEYFWAYPYGVPYLVYPDFAAFICDLYTSTGINGRSLITRKIATVNNVLVNNLNIQYPKPLLDPDSPPLSGFPENVRPRYISFPKPINEIEWVTTMLAGVPPSDDAIGLAEIDFRFLDKTGLVNYILLCNLSPATVGNDVVLRVICSNGLATIVQEKAVGVPSIPVGWKEYKLKLNRNKLLTFTYDKITTISVDLSSIIPGNTLTQVYVTQSVQIITFDEPASGWPDLGFGKSEIIFRP